jgi:hypothetical protein
MNLSRLFIGLRRKTIIGQNCPKVNAVGIAAPRKTPRPRRLKGGGPSKF